MCGQFGNILCASDLRKVLRLMPLTPLQSPPLHCSSPLARSR
jgi:hypothetical protein